MTEHYNVISVNSSSILYIKNCIFKDNLNYYPKINYTDSNDIDDNQS
jgi:hypothetical protein